MIIKKRKLCTHFVFECDDDVKRKIMALGVWPHASKFIAWNLSIALKDEMKKKTTTGNYIRFHFFCADSILKREGGIFIWIHLRNLVCKQRKRVRKKDNKESICHLMIICKMVILLILFIFLLIFLLSWLLKNAFECWSVIRDWIKHELSDRLRKTSRRCDFVKSII